MSDWIKVEDRLPEIGYWVFAYTYNIENERMTTMMFLDSIPDNQPLWLCMQGDFDMPVTDWMPLPEPPED